MWEVLSKLSGDELLVLFVAAMVTVAGLIVSCLAVWQAHRDREMAVTIIQDMLDQGMSPDQIERVLKAAGFDRGRRGRNALGDRLQAIRDKVTKAAS